jgi:Tat protein translocase TatC
MKKMAAPVKPLLLKYTLLIVSLVEFYAEFFHHRELVFFTKPLLLPLIAAYFYYSRTKDWSTIDSTMMVAFLVSLPWVLYQTWAFVAPALYLHEKRLIAPLVISSSVLFILGVAFCYFFVFGTVFKFINDFAPKSISVAPDIENYLDFVFTMCLAFGITFEVPVVVVVLVVVK